MKEASKSPARKAIDICWNRCLPKYRHKYLQGTEILGLIRELETFLGIRQLLKPEEETLLRKTLKLKPSLRLFKGECLSFILGLVHFSSVEEFLETRFRISPGQLRALVETITDNSVADNKDSKWGHNSKFEGTYQTYGSDSTDYLKAGDRNLFSGNSQEPGSWYSKRGYGSYNYHLSDKKSDLPSSENKETMLSGWLGKVRKYISETLTTQRQNEPQKETSSKYNPSFNPPIKSEDTSYGRKFNAVNHSLAGVRSNTQKFESDMGFPSGKSIYESLDELQAAVRDQAQVISRLEKERGRNYKTRVPGLISRMFVPWDYFSGYVTTFLRDLVNELLPQNTKRTVPEFVLRVISLVLGYFVIMNFFRLIYFLAVLTMYSSETALPYIFSNEDPPESAPLSWLQEYPALEYWAYSLREWTGY